ncbi:hypothetical protein [Leifsonia sp. NCR5]|uniref:hypothetical protein n=1 Tax=Leifsonia sp. NCR5 TaxID=1978342 RepID=UPI000A18B04B|nr:hypothetical protein [Leifsonia sp. NCR5]
MRVVSALIKTAAVLAVGGAGLALGLVALRSPSVDLARGDYEGIVVWTNVRDAPVKLRITLQEDGRLDLYVVSSFPEVPSIEDGRWTVTRPEQQATMDGPPVSAIADVVYLQFTCSSQLDPSTVRLGFTPKATVTFTGGGRSCTKPTQSQTAKVELQADGPPQINAAGEESRTFLSGDNLASFSAEPVGRWTDATIDQRVARTPPLQYGQFIDGYAPPPGAAVPGPFSTLEASLEGRTSDLVDKTMPDEGVGNALTQSVTWSRSWASTDPKGADPATRTRLDATMVRWTTSSGTAWVQGLLLAAGVLLGVATSLAIEFILPSRTAAKADRSLDQASGILGDANGVMREARSVLRKARRTPKPPG